MNATLTKHETIALVAKFRRNTFGNVSDRLIASLIEKGLVDPQSKRLTEDGIATVEAYNRMS